LSSSNLRLTLWCNTIQLFHEYKRIRFIGPFKRENFKYRIEPHLLSSRSGKELTPDIIAANENAWLLIDLTTNTKSKEPKLKEYEELDHRNLSVYGFHVVDNKPDIITSRLSYIDDGDEFCQIIVKEKLELFKVNNLTNLSLRKALKDAEGINFNKLPTIPITLLPEMKQREIRFGLIDIILQLFDPKSNGKTVTEIVDDGLERLNSNLTISAKRSLIDKVKTQMNILIEKYLAEYLEFKDGKYRAKKKVSSYVTRKNIKSRILDWATEKKQVTIPKYLK